MTIEEIGGVEELPMEELSTNSPWKITQSLRIIMLSILTVLLSIALWLYSHPDWLSKDVDVSFSFKLTWGVIIGILSTLTLALVVITAFSFFKSAVGDKRTPGISSKPIQTETVSLLDDSKIDGRSPDDLLKRLLDNSYLYSTDSIEDLFLKEKLISDLRRKRKAELDNEVRLKLFRFATKLVSNITPEVFKDILGKINWLHLHSGEVLFNAGDKVDGGIFFLVKGSATLSTQDNHIVSSLRNGDIIGQTQLFSPSGKRNYTCTLESNSELIQLTLETFSSLSKTHPDIIISYIRTTLAQQWRVSDFTLNVFFQIPGMQNDLLDVFRDEDNLENILKEWGLNSLILDKEDSVTSSIMEVNAGDTLFHRGSSSWNKFYILLSGKVCISDYDQMHSRMSIFSDEKDGKGSSEADSNSSFVECTSGAILGAISFFVGCPRMFSVMAVKACSVLCISADYFSNVLDRDKALEFSIRVARVLEERTLHLSMLGFERKWLYCGERVFSKNEKADALFLIVSGRLRIIDNDQEKHYIEFGRGECVGEMALLSGQTHHSSSVLALRDTELVKINDIMLKKTSESFPGILSKLSQMMAIRLARTSTNKHLNKVNTIALFPTSTSHEFKDFRYMLEVELRRYGSVICVEQEMVEDIISAYSSRNVENKSQENKESYVDIDSADYLYRMKIASLFSDFESSYRFVIFCGEYDLSSWTQCCIRQADLVYVLASGSSSPNVSSLERTLLWDQAYSTFSRKELVLFHGRFVVLPENTKDWLKLRRLNFYHHIKIGNTSHILRLTRHIAGKTVGLVLGGGGARGLSHLGVIRAILEANIPIDYIGGTSQGAFMGALYAFHENMHLFERDTKLFSEKLGNIWELLADATIPLMSYFSGKNFSQSIKSFFPDAKIEDLWIPFFCVTTNFSGADIGVHRTDVLWEVLRASMSVIGYLPPMYVRGEVLIDDLNNLPVDVMKDLWSPYLLIAVDVESKNSIYFKDTINFGTHLSGSWLLFRKLMTWLTLGLYKQPKIPSYAQIVSSLIYMNHNRNLRQFVNDQVMDIYVKPELGNTMLLDYHKLGDIVQIGYKYAGSAIVEWKLQHKERFDVGSHGRSASHGNIGVIAIQSHIRSKSHNGLNRRRRSGDL